MVEKPDAGDIVDQERVEIAFTDTAHDVFGKVTDAAVTVLARAWPLLQQGTAPRDADGPVRRELLRRPQTG